MKYLVLIFISTVLSACHTPSSKNFHERKSKICDIGTQVFIWTDTSRIDPYYGGQRLVNVQIWYPIDEMQASEAHPVSAYIQQLDTISKRLEWPQEDYRLAASVPTHSLLDVPITGIEGSFPLLICSPALGGHYSYFTYYAEQMVKQGFVVVGVNHLYESEYVYDPEGQIYPYSSQFHDSLESLDIPDDITADGFRQEKSTRSKVLAEDLLFVLDQLTKLNADRFDGKINCEEVGAWGHSIGGAAAIYARLLDDRIKAVINLDGTPPSPGLAKGINVPFLFIEDLTDYRNHKGYKIQFDRRSDFCKKGGKDAYRIMIGDIQHNSYLDIHYYAAVDQTEADRQLALMNQVTGYMRDFFHGYLQEEPFSLSPLESDSLEILVF